MPTAEELAKSAEQQKKESEPKPLPAMVSPTVNLPVELRQAIALRCRDTGESFSLVTSKIWFDLLKKEGKVKADLKIDFSAKRAGGGMKAKVEAKDAEIEELKKQIEALKAAKK